MSRLKKDLTSNLRILDKFQVKIIDTAISVRFANGRSCEFTRSVRENEREFGTAQRFAMRKLLSISHANCGSLSRSPLIAEERRMALFRGMERDFPFSLLFAGFNFSIIAEWDLRARRVASKRNTADIFAAVTLKTTRVQGATYRYVFLLIIYSF